MNSEKVFRAAAVGATIALATMVVCRPAKAGATIVTTDCTRASCSTSVVRVSPGPVVRHVAQPHPGSAEGQAKAAREAEWEARCVVGYRFDNEGVRYAVYASKACSHGY